MCQYWKKQHTCTHPSDRPYIEMCRPGFLSNTVCPDISEDPNLRASHFPCWSCIKALGRFDAEEKRMRSHQLASAAEKARSLEAKEKAEAEKRAREERVRREAREKAERERAAEQKGRVEREKEAERARREGGLWVLAEAGSGKKKKKEKVSMSGSPASPVSPSVVMSAAKKDAWKESGKIAWKDDRNGDVTGRVGVWGPKRILSRKEGGAGVVGNRMDVASDMNGVQE